MPKFLDRSDKFAHVWVLAIAMCGGMCGCSPSEPIPLTTVDPQHGPGHRNGQWRTQLMSARNGDYDAIRVTEWPVTLEDLAELQYVTELTDLLIDSGGVTDEGLKHIAQLSRLEHLRLIDCPITDIGIELLADAGLNKLRILNIPDAEVTADGLAYLAKLPSLVQLRLGRSQLDDRAVSEIAKLPHLESLHLIGPSLTDAALDSLATAPELTSLYIDDCQLSDAAWERLFTAKPSLHVHIDQAHHDRDPSHHEHTSE
ncbi:MAG: hypothetical protein R3C53_23345 [Pirellulaceae bacterium]